ncbi:Arylsulfate sulfotransferase AssT [Escherichia coli]|uniref:aryl-sulfate sulfotransferase n=1 Tax=Escherichia coli TaxID=562 RepID=UPI000F139B7B|nr:Arylsulfate sulfotransferase AssT [Escherichia coli]
MDPAPSKGWEKPLASKLLKPVDANGKPITCNENSDFDFTYTQHAARISSKGTLTILIMAMGVIWNNLPYQP